MKFTQAKLAMNIAEEAHKGQRYGNHEYTYHLYQVAMMVKDLYAGRVSEELLDGMLAVAWLHDVIEDTEMTYAKLIELGIKPVNAHAVVVLTKREDVPYESYIDVICTQELARIVKLCDTSCNLYNSISEGRTKNINKYTKQIQLLGGF